MRNLKKVLVLVLCLAMMASIMVTGAAAAFTDQKDIDTKHQEAVDACVTLNIINGYPDGSFKPNDLITRAEMTKMMCVMLNGGKEPTLGTASTPFTDVPDSHWASAYVKALYNLGVIAGKSATSFDPAGQVTGVEEAKMLLVALGYDQDKAHYVGADWQIFVNANASAKGFYVDIEDIDPQEAITREHAAEMIWNALNAYEVEYVSVLETDANGQLTSTTKVQDRVVGETHDKINMLTDKYDTARGHAVLSSVKFDSDDASYTTITTTQTTTGPSNRAYDSVKNYAELLGQDVNIISTFDQKANEWKLLGMYASDQNKVVKFLADDADKLSNIAKGATVKVDDTNYKIDPNAQIVAPNGTKFTGTIQPYYNITIVSNDKNDSYYEYVIVEPYQVAKIASITASKVTLSAKGGTGALIDGTSFDLAKDDISVYEGAAKDDFALVVAKDYTVSGNTEVTKADVVSGTLTANRDAYGSIRVDSDWYTVANGATGSSLRNNDAYDFVVNNGFVFDADRTKGNLSASNVMYISKIGALTSGLADGVEAQVYFSDGTKQNVVIDAMTLPTNNKAVEYDIITANQLDDSTTPTAAAVDAVTYAYNQPTALNDTDLNNLLATADDELYAPVAASILNKLIDKGYRLFTFEQNGSSYSVEAIYDYDNDAIDNIGSFDNFHFRAGTIIKDAKDTEKDRFNNDAVIFLHDDDGTRVVSGQTVNKWKETKTVRVNGLADSTSGVSYFAIGYVDLGTATAKDAAANYGYVTSKVSTTSQGNTDYYSFTMWNGSKDVDVMVKQNGTTSAIARGSFVSFNWKDADAGIADTNDFIVKAAPAYATPINAVAAGDSVTFAMQQEDENGVAITATGTSGGTAFDFSDDAVVIYVDTKNAAGVDAGELDKSGTYSDPYTYADAVAFVVWDGTTPYVEALFVDPSGMYTKKDGNQIVYNAGTRYEVDVVGGIPSYNPLP